MSKQFNDWFKISMVAHKRAEISIHGIIGLPKWLQDYGYSAAGTFKEFETELRALGDNINEIDLSVYSLGGSVFDALGIHNILSRHTARVNAVVDGVAASAASFVLMAADEIAIPSNAYLMIHNTQSWAEGDRRDLGAQAEQMERWDDDIARMYANRIVDRTEGAYFDKTLADVRAMMDADTWINGTDAVAMGLADRVADEVALAACVTAPRGVRNVLGGVDLANAPEELRAVFDTLETPTSNSMKNKTAPVAPAPAAPAPTASAEPVIETPAAPAAVAAPAAPAPAAPAPAPTASADPAPAAPAPAAPAEPAPAALTVEDLQNAIAAALTPLTEKVTQLEALHNAGVKPGGWNATPANVSVPEEEESLEGKTPLQLINLGRTAAQKKLRALANA